VSISAAQRDLTPTDFDLVSRRVAMPTAVSTASSRDDFSPETKDLLAKRAGYICAFPGCRRLTVGPSEDRLTGTTMVGVAAHITAAGVGGPRYEASLSREDRSSERNGVWLCQTHGKLVDDNPSVHTVQQIARWKKQHEDWVFARVSNSDNHLTDGISRIRLAHLGPFGERVDVKLGRHNVLYGSNQAGKSTLCEAIAAFSGRANYDRFARRWDFCRGSARDTVIEAVASQGDVATTVSLIQQRLAVRYKHKSPQPQRLRIEVDGGIAPSWPRALFNVILLNGDIFRSREGPNDKFAHAIWFLASQLDVDEQNVWDMLDGELFATSTFGYRARRRGKQRAEFATPDSGKHYTKFDGLSGGERILAMLDILLKLLRTDCRNPPWLLALDSGFFGVLSTRVKQYAFETLTADVGVPLQTIFCVTFEEDAEALRIAANDTWIGAASAGKVTVHAFL
jgi:hypothetical protein